MRREDGEHAAETIAGILALMSIATGDDMPEATLQKNQNSELVSAPSFQGSKPARTPGDPFPDHATDP